MSDWKARLERVVACVVAVCLAVERIVSVVERVLKLFKQ